MNTCVNFAKFTKSGASGNQRQKIYTENRGKYKINYKIGTKLIKGLWLLTIFQVNEDKKVV